MNANGSREILVPDRSNQIFPILFWRCYDSACQGQAVAETQKNQTTDAAY